MTSMSGSFCPAGGCTCSPCETYVGNGVCVNDAGEVVITPGVDTRSPMDANCPVIYLPSKLDYVTHLPSCPLVAHL